MEEKVLKEKAVSGVFWKFFERIGNQLVSLVVSIVLARLLLPEDYSVVSIVTIFFSFCNIFISSGLSSALIQKKEVDAIDFSSVLFVNLIIATILYIAIFFLAPVIANIYNMDILIPIMRVMGITFFIYMFHSVINAYISRNMQFKKTFFTTLIGHVVSGIIGIVMALKGFGAWALVAQQLSSASINCLVLYKVSKIKFVFKISKTRLLPLTKYSWKIFASAVISNIFIEVKPLIIGLQYTTNDLAYYNKAENYPRLIATSIDGTLASVLIPVIKEVQDDKEKVLRYLRRFFNLSSYLIFPSMLGFAAISTNFISVLLTDKWLPSAPFLVAFCFSYMLEFLTLGTGQTLKAIGKTGLVLVIEIIKKSITAIILIMAVVIGGSPMIFAYVTVICALISVIIETIVIRKEIGYKYSLLMKDIGANAIISILMFIVVNLVNSINLNIYLMLVLQILIGCISYLVFSILTRNKTFKYFYTKLKKILARKN